MIYAKMSREQAEHELEMEKKKPHNTVLEVQSLKHAIKLDIGDKDGEKHT